MFIRETKTGSAADGTARITFRLVESRRIDGKVRQHTLLNLGRHFAVDREDWPLLMPTHRGTAVGSDGARSGAVLIWSSYCSVVH